MLNRLHMVIHSHLPTITVACAVLFVGMVWNGAASAASFDCRLARATTERTLCDTPELSAMDEDLASLYSKVKAHSGQPERAAQRHWLRRRDACAVDIACIRAAYIDRIGSLLRLPPSKVGKLNNASTAGPKLHLKSGWVIDDREDAGIGAPCPELRDHMNRTAAYWWHWDSGRYVSECATGAARAFFFSLPPWRTLDAGEHKELIARLLRYKEEGAFRYVEGPPKHDDAYYLEEARKFIANDGSLRIVTTRLLNHVEDVRTRQPIVVAGQVQQVAQLGFPVPTAHLHRYQEPGCQFQEEDTELFLLSENLSGPAPVFAPELFATMLMLYRGHPALMTAGDNQVELIFPVSTESDCKLRFIEQMGE